MIYYNPNHFWKILFSMRGSPLRGNGPGRALKMAVVALLITYIYETIKADVNYHSWINQSTTAFSDTLSLSNVFIGLMISFRLNSAFQQWRSGVTAIGSFAEKARHLISLTCTFLNIQTVDNEKKELKCNFKRKSIIIQAEIEKEEEQQEEKEKEAISNNMEAIDSPSVAPLPATIETDPLLVCDLDDPEESLLRKHAQMITQMKCQMLTDMRRLVLLYIAIVFHDCRERTDIMDLKDANLLTDDELHELQAIGAGTGGDTHRYIKGLGLGLTFSSQPWWYQTTERASPALSSSSSSSSSSYSHSYSYLASPNRLRAAVVELWLRRLIQAGHQRAFLSTPTDVNTLNGLVTNLTELFNTVYAIAHIPIPFSYTQFIQLCLVLYLVLYTVVIVPNSMWYTPLWVFLIGLVFFIADDVAREIECPFGVDDNDIDLELRLLHIEDELTVLVKSQYHVGGYLTKVSENHESEGVLKPAHATLPSGTTTIARKQSTLNGSFRKQRVISQAVADLPTQETKIDVEVTDVNVSQIDEYTALIVQKQKPESQGGYGSSATCSYSLS